MLKKIDILGMQIDNHTVREAMTKVESYLESVGMNTIETIDMKMLDMAETDEGMKRCIESLDLTIIGEKEILTAVSVHSSQRINETENHEFFREFMKRILRHKNSVFLLAETNEELTELRDFLEEQYERIVIAGSCAAEELSGDVEGVINEINGAAADVLLSVLPSPAQEHFLTENRNKLDVKIWYGIGDNYMLPSGIGRLSNLAGKLIHKKKLLSQLHKYNKN